MRLPSGETCAIFILLGTRFRVQKQLTIRNRAMVVQNEAQQISASLIPNPRGMELGGQI
jgi:hypothetical protein